MRLWLASSARAAALIAAFGLAPVAAGYAPAWCQDFSITNQMEPANRGHPDVMRQLQAWWNTHAYYPRRASDSDESGTVKIHLVILPDGRIWTIDLVQSSGSRWLDTAGVAVFGGASVRPFPPGEQTAYVNLWLHYVLTDQPGQPAAAGYTPVSSQRPFTITNAPAKSPILDTMLQRVCTGTIVLGGVPDHPVFGVRSWAQAVFFRKPDGTPWVKFYERGHASLAPVTQIGQMVTWPGRHEHTRNTDTWLQYTVWPDGADHLSGAIGSRMISTTGVPYNDNLAGNTVDLTCTKTALPTVTWNDLLEEQNTSTVFSPTDLSSVDPP